jgi:hypothetical protein
LEAIQLAFDGSGARGHRSVIPLEGTPSPVESFFVLADEVQVIHPEQKTALVGADPAGLFEAGGQIPAALDGIEALGWSFPRMGRR